MIVISNDVEVQLKINLKNKNNKLTSCDTAFVKSMMVRKYSAYDSRVLKSQKLEYIVNQLKQLFI
jgi:hypothetical protein